MKLFTSVKWLALFLCCFLAFGQGSVAWAQPMEEDEEPVQTRPNPMDRSGKMERGHIDRRGSHQGTTMQQRSEKSMSNKMRSGAVGGKAAHPGGAMQQRNR